MFPSAEINQVYEVNLSFTQFSQTYLFNIYFFNLNLTISININCLSGCLYVCLNTINVKTAEPIGPKFSLGPHMTPRMVLDDQNFKNSIFIKFRKSTIFFLICKLCYCFTTYARRKCS